MFYSGTALRGGTDIHACNVIVRATRKPSVRGELLPVISTTIFVSSNQKLETINVKGSARPKFPDGNAYFENLVVKARQHLARPKAARIFCRRASTDARPHACDCQPPQSHSTCLLASGCASRQSSALFFARTISSSVMRRAMPLRYRAPTCMPCPAAMSNHI